MTPSKTDQTLAGRISRQIVEYNEWWEKHYGSDMCVRPRYPNWEDYWQELDIEFQLIENEIEMKATQKWGTKARCDELMAQRQALILAKRRKVLDFRPKRR